VKRLVLLGGGHAHLHVLRELAQRPDDTISVTLVSPAPLAYYSGMIPGWFAGHYTLAQCAVDLLTLAGRAHASFTVSPAVLVNPGMRDVILANSQVIPYDVLSIDIGLQPMMGAAMGVAANAFVVRPFERAIEGWEHDRQVTGGSSVDLRPVGLRRRAFPPHRPADEHRDRAEEERETARQDGARIGAGAERVHGRDREQRVAQHVDRAPRSLRQARPDERREVHGEEQVHPDDAERHGKSQV